MNGDAKSTYLRSALRGGYLTDVQRREAVIQLYHHERAMQNLGDGSEYWYETKVMW